MRLLICLLLFILLTGCNQKLEGDVSKYVEHKEQLNGVIVYERDYRYKIILEGILVGNDGKVKLLNKCTSCANVNNGDIVDIVYYPKSKNVIEIKVVGHTDERLTWGYKIE